MFNWLKRWIIKKEMANFVKNPETSDAMAVFADQYLKTTMKKHSDTLRVAEKLNKASLLSMQEKDLRSELKQGLGDDEDEEDYDDEDEEEGDDYSDKMLKQVAQQILPRLLGSNAGTPTSNTPAAEVPVTDLRAKASKALQGLTDAQLKILHDKGYF